jgi:hypothetical protein
VVQPVKLGDGQPLYVVLVAVPQGEDPKAADRSEREQDNRGREPFRDGHGLKLRERGQSRRADTGEG